MSQTSLKDRLLVATLPADERENGRRLLSALAPIESKLKLVEARLQERTRSGIPTISLIGDYLVEGGGKRIRPALLLLGSATTRTALVVSAALYGLTFGNAYTFFVAHVLRHVPSERRGAAFGAMIAAFDTGIGTGSMALGALAEGAGFGRAFHVGGALALLSPVIFLLAERRFLRDETAARPAGVSG